MRPLGYTLSILALFALAGGHLALMQTVAWTGMLIDYGKQYGLSEGVSKTFDGEHPCSLCLKVKEQKEKEDAQAPLAKTETKSEKFLACASPALPVRIGAPFSFFSPWKINFSSRSDSLPSPVPRSAIL